METEQQPSPSTAGGGMSRRRFATLAAGGVGALVLGGVSAFRIFDAEGRAVRSFEVRHDPSVYVTMTNGRSFVVEVKRRGSGEVLERHADVTAHSLLSLRSDHVAISELV